MSKKEDKSKALVKMRALRERSRELATESTRYSDVMHAVGVGALSSWAAGRGAARAGGETNENRNQILGIDSDLAISGMAAMAGLLFSKELSKKSEDTIEDIMAGSLTEFLERVRGDITRINGYRYIKTGSASDGLTKTHNFGFNCSNKDKKDIADIIIMITHDVNEKLEIEACSTRGESRLRSYWKMM